MIRGYNLVKKRIAAPIKYDKKNSEHEAKLQKLWSTLKPDEALSERLTKKWIDIGFQGADPSTDFRGSGILGLDQLLTVTTEEPYKTTGLEMYQDSTNEAHWYFFSVTGINIT